MRQLDDMRPEVEVTYTGPSYGQQLALALLKAALTAMVGVLVREVVGQIESPRTSCEPEDD